MKFKLGVLLVCSFLLSACNPLTLYHRALEAIDPSEKGIFDAPMSLEEQAQAILTDFYQLLNDGDYAQAAAEYGGSFDVLQRFNPEIDPDDKVSLLQAGCEINGLMCLPVLNATLIDSNEQGEFNFEVVYARPDGTPFVLLPCCGLVPLPAVSEFTVQVICDADDTCQVQDLPPYAP